MYFSVTINSFVFHLLVLLELIFARNNAITNLYNNHCVNIFPAVNEAAEGVMSEVKSAAVPVGESFVCLSVCSLCLSNRGSNVCDQSSNSTS